VGWLDRIRGGWYQQHDTAANPLIRPGRKGLQAAGLEPTPPDRPATSSRLRHRARDRSTREVTMQLSARNQLTGTVTSVELGAVMAEVTVDVTARRSSRPSPAALPSASAWPKARP